MTVNVSLFCQSSGVTSSKVSYSNTIHHFCMNTALLPLRTTLDLKKNSSCNTKEAYLSGRYHG